MRILILEDNIRLATGLKKRLSQEGYAIDVLHDGEEGASVLDYQEYDLLILDLGLPGMDGIDILKKMRKNNKTMPVLITSARFKLDQKILGLEAGADDYIAKPFDLKEIVARVHALLRRSQQKGQTTIQLGDLTFNVLTRMLTKGDEHIHLSNRELSVFEYLISQVNVVLSKENISNHVGNFDNTFTPHAIETYISRIRKKLGSNVQIKTFPGLGYMISTK
ncbi:response regulator transcription factor [Sulfurospirillum arcachonense]|uniref:response regulator transcription factor n=1 Tax=Sulfurospirillum arcachonense TaxID=57666 RepID=UPI00046801E0|nr:response regulator transcription factor [Sulfurospirillum arcachonense]